MRLHCCAANGSADDLSHKGAGGADDGAHDNCRRCMYVVFVV
jgi:hypothetical protein